MDKNLLTNHRRNLDAATPIRLTAIRWWNLGGALSQSSMGHGCPMVSMIEKKHIYILLHYESSTLYIHMYIPEFHSEFNGHFPMVSQNCQAQPWLPSVRARPAG
jgi:hypothetical protein